MIPITPIWRRYQTLRGAHQSQRLEAAKELADRPDILAEEFAASVAHFGSYENVAEPFYPANRATRTFGDAIARTNDLVLRLETQRLAPVDAPDRRTEHGAGPRIVAVPAEDLACDYVDRELLVQRTMSPAKWEDGRENIGGLRLDVLLADAADRTPIVGELKLPGDMDPFFALIQALACAAHLATAHQYERVRRQYPGAGFRELAAAPLLDVWVLSVYAAGERPRGRFMAELQDAAEAIAPGFLAQEAVRGSVRRIAGVGLRVEEGGRIASEVLWAWGREG